MIRFKFTDAQVREYALPEGVTRGEIWDTEIKHLCCRVSHTGKKVFQVIGKLHGKTARVSLGDFPALSVDGTNGARQKARKALVAMADGVNLNEAKKQKRTDAKEKPGTLYSVYESMVTIRPRAKNTMYSYKASLKHLEKWHHLPVASITRQMVLTRYQEVKTESGPYAANRMADFLSAVCNFSRILTGKPEANPVTIIRDTKARFIEEPREHCLSAEELKLFVAELDNLRGNNARDIMLTLLLTGMRKSEAMGLRWENIDLENRSLVVPETKTGKPLVLPLSTPLADMFKARWEVWQRPDRGAVFPTSSEAGHAKNIDDSTKHIKMLIPHYHPHILRKTYSTVAINIGVDGMVVDRLTNHVPRGMTARHYYKPDVEALREPVERIASALLNIEKAGGVPA